MDNRKHGGSRPNSGRKQLYNEPTGNIKVPLSKHAIVHRWLKKFEVTPAKQSQDCLK